MEGRNTRMQGQDRPDTPRALKANGCFVLIIQGATPWAGVLKGIEAVKDALVRTLWRDPERAVLGEVAALLASLDDPASWLTHGSGDGRPHWHWWIGFEGGSATVQRLTELPPSGRDLNRLRSVLDELGGTLAGHAEDLRRLSAAGHSGYVFVRRSPGPQEG